MAYQALVTVTLNRGGEWGSEFQITPTQKAAVIVQPPNFMGNTIIGVVERVIVFQTTTNAFLVAVRESVQVTERGIWFEPDPDLAAFGGYFIRLYAVNKPQINPTSYTIYRE